ncbi:hypothetical protein QTP88_015479 [Uroleucon formosanum]
MPLRDENNLEISGINEIDEFGSYEIAKENLSEDVHSRGGGVLIAVHNHFCLFELTLSDPTLECVAIMLKLVHISSLYTT